MECIIHYFHTSVSVHSFKYPKVRLKGSPSRDNDIRKYPGTGMCCSPVREWGEAGGRHTVGDVSEGIDEFCDIGRDDVVLF